MTQLRGAKEMARDDWKCKACGQHRPTLNRNGWCKGCVESYSRYLDHNREFSPGR